MLVCYVCGWCVTCLSWRCICLMRFMIFIIYVICCLHVRFDFAAFSSFVCLNGCKSRDDMCWNKHDLNIHGQCIHHHDNYMFGNREHSTTMFKCVLATCTNNRKHHMVKSYANNRWLSVACVARWVFHVFNVSCSCMRCCFKFLWPWHAMCVVYCGNVLKFDPNKWVWMPTTWW